MLHHGHITHTELRSYDLQEQIADLEDAGPAQSIDALLPKFWAWQYIYNQ